MSETETEGMFADLGDIADPGAWTEDDGTGETEPGDVWSEDDGTGAEGGILGDLGDLVDQAFDTDGQADQGDLDFDQNPEAIDQML